MDLDEHQVEAVKEAVRNGVLVITGGPGTGKTTTINTIIKYFESEGITSVERASDNIIQDGFCLRHVLMALV